MANKKIVKAVETVEVDTEKKLTALYKLQMADSEIDKIRILRGELPLEVQDLEDEVEGLQTRATNFDDEIEKLKKSVADKKNRIKESHLLIKKYEEQQKNVRNNREFDSLTKEIEFQSLEIELSEKHIKGFEAEAKTKIESIETAKTNLDERKDDLAHKKSELDSIISDTQKEEENLLKKSAEVSQFIEKRLLAAYRRIRKNARNGLAIVSIERNACGGCYNKIPPQRKVDIRSRKKIIVCEYCGRILVDNDLIETIK